MKRLTVIGVGPGAEDLLTIRAKNAIDEADIVFAAQRYEGFAKGKKVYPLKPFSKACEIIESEIDHADIAVIVSGDPTKFSFTSIIRQRFSSNEDIDFKVIPGVSSIEMLFCEIFEASQDAILRSLHGREFNPALIASLVRENPLLVFLTDDTNNPVKIAEALCRADLGEIDIVVGENLSYENQVIWRGNAEKLRNENIGGHAVVRIKNPEPKKSPISPMLTDDAMIRAERPMTKEEVRMLSVCKLGLERDSVVWDAGAGTGSVAMQCAMLCPEGKVFAIEREADGIDLIKKNAEALNLLNITAVHGDMPAALNALPKPTHVFIGGSGGEMRAILDLIRSKGSKIRIVLNAITLKSAYSAQEILSSDGFNGFECVQIQVSKSSNAGIMRANNPIMIISAYTN